MSFELEALQRMSRDVRKSADLLSVAEARFLVDAYYTMQKSRIAADHQSLALTKSGEPGSVLDWLGAQHELLEKQLRGALFRYARNSEVGQWMLDITGIGPVIAAGLLAHIDIKRAPAASHIWSYAGLNPEQVWAKGIKRPWNAALKTLCWKLGHSFVMTSGADDPYYATLIKARKEIEIAKNLAGDFKDQAYAALEKKKYGEDTLARAAYLNGQLPAAQIQRRAERWGVKQFLSDLHFVWYTIEFDRNPALPYPIVHQGHVHRRLAPHVMPYVKEMGQG